MLNLNSATAIRKSLCQHRQRFRIGNSQGPKLKNLPAGRAPQDRYFLFKIIVALKDFSQKGNQYIHND